MSEACGPAWTEMSRLEATCIGVHISWSHHRRGAGGSQLDQSEHAPTRPHKGLLAQPCYCEMNEATDTGSSFSFILFL